MHADMRMQTYRNYTYKICQRKYLRTEMLRTETHIRVHVARSNTLPLYVHISARCTHLAQCNPLSTRSDQCYVLKAKFPKIGTFRFLGL